MHPMDRTHPPRPIRVLVVGVGWPMETFIERLLTGLAADDFEVALESKGKPDAAWLRTHGITWRFGPRPLARTDLVGQARRNGVASVATSVGRAASAAVRGPASLVGEFDAIYAPWLNTLIDHPRLRHCGLPVLTSCRGALVTIAPWDPGRPGYAEALTAVFHDATLIHCVSEAIVADAAEFGLDPAKARVIRPAVDPAVFHPAEAPPQSGRLRLVAVGGLTWRKDYEHALMAVRRAVDMGADVGLELIGDGEDRQHLQFAVADLQLTDRVTLLGRLSPAGILARLQQSHAFLHTSASEGISNAVLEAMATGLPVVTTDSGGMGEAVRDGIDGMVVGVRDTEGIATAIAKLAAEPALRQAMGASARERIVSAFSLSQQIEDFGALLHEVVGR